MLILEPRGNNDRRLRRVWADVIPASMRTAPQSSHGHSVDAGAGFGALRSGPCLVEVLEGRVLLSVSGTSTTAPQVTAADATTAAGTQPMVTSTTPAPGATNVPLDSFVSCEVFIPNGGIDPATLNPNSAYLILNDQNLRIPVTVNTTGGGDAIIVKPKTPLQSITGYTFVVTSAVKDVSGAAFAPFQMQFTTGTTTTKLDPTYAGVNFQQVVQSKSANQARYQGVTVGPDHKLYAVTDDGRIFRFSIASDGTLGTPQIITTVSDNNGGPRSITGLAFDPQSTSSNLMLWITHSAAGVSGAPDWAGKVSLLSGADLENYQDEVVNLPRSSRDHQTEQLVFGPDHNLYFCQGSMTAMGAPDAAWGNRSEHLLSAAILKVDLGLLANVSLPLDVKTSDGGGTYDPAATGAPLTIYASGVRNAYDLLWHSNGNLYAPTNGSAAGGNVPAGPSSPALKNVQTSEPDYLFRVAKNKYYGHPDPVRKQYVFNGGNPTSGVDPYEASDYPVGTQPDPNWRGAVFNFGNHESPNGIIEYHGKAFGGVLDHTILVCRYSGDNDIELLKPSPDGLGIETVAVGIQGFKGFQNPLDLTEDQGSGNIYVVEYADSSPTGRITLLKTGVSSPTPTPTPTPTPVPTPIPTPMPPPPPPDTTPPSATIANVPTVTAAGGTALQVQVTYTDDKGVDATTVGVDDIGVSRNGAPLTVTGVSVTGSGASIVATYTVQPPGGSFDYTDDGSYAVAVNPGAVVDTSGNNSAASSTTFDVQVPAPPAPIRSKAEQKVIRSILKFAATKGLSVPDLTYLPGSQLKGVLLGMKLEVKTNVLVTRVRAMAVKKQYPLPDLSNYSYSQLKLLQQTIKKQHPPA